ncbi:MAG: protein-L-isoaspartate(D-aspartate) O-methyltransferase [Pseudomonadota bacterium]
MFAEDKIRLLMTLRGAGITDRKVMEAIETVRREDFVPDALAYKAYENVALPIGLGQTISQPLMVALMTVALEVDQTHKVLEVGTGSGYQAAILHELARRVYTVERHRALYRTATQRFEDLGLHRITTRYGDGSIGWREQAPFSRILVTAAASDIPEVLCDQLAEGGVLVIPIGRNEPNQKVIKVRREADTFTESDVTPAYFVPLLPGVDSDGL